MYFLSEMTSIDEQKGFTNRIRRVSYNDIKSILVLLHELKAVTDVQREFRTEETLRHAWKVLLRNVDDILEDTVDNRHVGA